MARATIEYSPPAIGNADANSAYTYAMGTASSAATSMLRKAPVPACEITPGTITKTDEAGVTDDSVRRSAPITRMLRFSARGGG